MTRQRPKRYPKSETFTRVDLVQLSKELGLNIDRTRRVLDRGLRLGLLHVRLTPPGTVRTYDAVEVETLKALIGVPDRPAPQPQDWLTPYEKENTHDARRKRPREPHRPRSTQP